MPARWDVSGAGDLRPAHRETTMRLPPLSPATLDEPQRAFADKAEAMIKKRGFDKSFKTHDAQGALIGPWTIWLRHPAIGEAAAMLTKAVSELDALPPRAHEVVILVIGSRFGAAYELYAHCAVARDRGLTDRQIAALCASTCPDGLSDDEALAFACTDALARGGVLPGFLYAAAGEAFGEAGRAQLVHLAGVYAYVSIILNAHAVPAPEDRAGG